MKKLALVSLVLVACGDDGNPAQPDATVEQPLLCDVAIVGGGAGGVYTAFRLAPSLGASVCLFEKEAQLGGRLKDIPQHAGDPTSPRFGAGGMRVMEGQQLLFDLATELGITFQTPELEADFINARGEWSFDKEGLVDQYNLTPDAGGDTEYAFYEAIGLQVARADIGNFKDFRTWVTSKIGAEGLSFMRDMSRFRADFEYPLDARGYMDWLDEEWDVCCTPSYPIGGMTQFILKMAEAATTSGAQIFTSEPVSTIERETAMGTYKLTTSSRTVRATKVVLAIPPYAVKHLSGDVIDDLKAQRNFQDIIGVKVATVATWWPTAWWANLTNPSATAPLNNIWRAWSTGHCFTAIEIPLQAYAASQTVTRSVYSDDRECVDFWESLSATQGEPSVAAEVKRGLEYMFNTTNLAGGSPATIPLPLKTYTQIWEGGWHWLRAGTAITNQQLFDWAVQPLPDANVHLVGEAYNVQRSGWSDAAYKSAINMLNTKFGMSITVPRTRPAPAKFQRTRWDLRRN
jgi:glycine/D-amino acid oxidase-like deaminating enzyme